MTARTMRKSWRGWWWRQRKNKPAIAERMHADPGPLREMVLMRERRGLPLLKLDVDGKRRPSLTVIAQRLDRAGIDCTWLIERRSPSGRGWHRWIAVAQMLEPSRIVALQAICGSDLLREAYNFNRAGRVERGEAPASWARRWNVLYK